MCAYVTSPTSDFSHPPPTILPCKNPSQPAWINMDKAFSAKRPSHNSQSSPEICDKLFLKMTTRWTPTSYKYKLYITPINGVQNG